MSVKEEENGELGLTCKSSSSELRLLCMSSSSSVYSPSEQGLRCKSAALASEWHSGLLLLPSELGLSYTFSFSSSCFGPEISVKLQIFCFKMRVQLQASTSGFRIRVKIYTSYYSSSSSSFSSSSSSPLVNPFIDHPNVCRLNRNRSSFPHYIFF